MIQKVGRHYWLYEVVFVHPHRRRVYHVGHHSWRRLDCWLKTHSLRVEEDAMRGITYFVLT